MANATENRPLSKSSAESEFDRGTGSSPYKSMGVKDVKQDTQNIWVYVVIGLVIAGGGLYYYMKSNATTVVTPAITETTPPPTTVAPKTVTPPAVTPDPSIAPKTTP